MICEARITTPKWQSRLWYDDDGYVCKAEEGLKAFEILALDEWSVMDKCDERGWQYEHKWLPEK